MPELEYKAATWRKALKKVIKKDYLHTLTHFPDLYSSDPHMLKKEIDAVWEEIRDKLTAAPAGLVFGKKKAPEDGVWSEVYGAWIIPNHRSRWVRHRVLVDRIYDKLIDVHVKIKAELQTLEMLPPSILRLMGE